MRNRPRCHPHSVILRPNIFRPNRLVRPRLQSEASRRFRLESAGEYPHLLRGNVRMTPYGYWNSRPRVVGRQNACCARDRIAAAIACLHAIGRRPSSLSFAAGSRGCRSPGLHRNAFSRGIPLWVRGAGVLVPVIESTILHLEYLTLYMRKKAMSSRCGVGVKGFQNSSPSSRYTFCTAEKAGSGASTTCLAPPKNRSESTGEIAAAVSSRSMTSISVRYAYGPSNQ